MMKIFLILGFIAGITIASGKSTDSTLKDIDGNTYKTVKIGTQTWTAENFRTRKMNDGTPILFITNSQQWKDATEPACCIYEYDELNEDYGLLYNLIAVKTKKLAPKGWHVATDEDWKILDKYLTAAEKKQLPQKATNTAAKAIASKDKWEFDNELEGSVGTEPLKNNSSGFSGLPGGSVNEEGIFSNLGELAYWWSPDFATDRNAIFRYIDYKHTVIFSDGCNSKCGFSVRLVKDKEK